MKIKNQFRVPVPVERAWLELNDVPKVATCAPGAELLEQKPDGSYDGSVSVKLGPVALSFRGTLVYKERDESKHRVVAEAAGNEARARGTARALVTFVLSPDGTGTRVDVDTDVQLAGSIAQYGRGAALIQSTAQVLMDEFARNFAAKLDQVAPPWAGSGAASPSRANKSEIKPVSAISLMAKTLALWARSLLRRERA